VSRDLALVFRGTGGIIGEDYVSRVCQGAEDLVEEVHPKFPATMGGLPVGAATDPGDPSMQRAVDTAVSDAIDIINGSGDRRIVVGGYSAGAVAAARVREFIAKTCPERYVCSFSFGDPTRPEGGAYFAGTPAPGHGISTWRYGDVTDWRHCWLAQPGDMYASVPSGDTGLILGDFYDIVTRVQLSDPVGTLSAILMKLPDILTHAGILGDARHDVSEPVLNIIGGLLGGGQSPQDWLGGLLNVPNPAGLGNPLLLAYNSLVGLLDGEPDDIAAAINAAVVAIQFAASGTAPHITYETAQVWPGQTYLGLAIQHVRDWCSRT